MADDDNGFEETPDSIEQNKAEKRIKDLSEKVRATSTERDEATDAKAKAEAEIATARKEIEFYKDFSQQTSKYTAAAEYQDQIKEKVLAGYSVEDATVSVLNKEGKLTPQAAAPAPKDSPAGGSATNAISESSKDVADMEQAERREILSKNLDLS